MAENSIDELLRRFVWIAAAIGIIGAAIAFWADRPSVAADDGYWDAAREVGGALVAGSLIAGLVLWFEEHREDQRVRREEAREDRQFDRDEERAERAATAAWRRELDFQLVRLIHSELAPARYNRLARIHDLARRFEGETHSPAVLESFISASDRTACQLCVDQIVEVLNLIERSPERSNLQSAVMQWNTHDFTVGGKIVTPAEFQRVHGEEDRFWQAAVDALHDHLAVNSLRDRRQLP